MEFGVFDQNDRSGRPQSQQYQERLRLIELYDRLGFRTFHMSEHHATSLSTAPAPSVFMSAVAQRTHRLRLCPLVYLLPLYHPVRLAEEICMLDQLSGGRFEFGVGRGASPHELEALGIDPAKAARMYAEAFSVMERYFTAKVLDHEGEFWTIRDLAVEMEPFQKPRPPLWYALASPDSAVWPASQGANIVCGGPVARIRAISDRYRTEHAASRPDRVGEALIGVNRYVLVARDDETARDVGRRAWPVFYDNFIKLWRKHGTQPVNAKLPPDFDALLLSGHAVAGSVATVRAQLAEQIEGGGLNYLIGSFIFGSMTHDEAVASVTLFGEEVMPYLRERGRDRIAA